MNLDICEGLFLKLLRGENVVLIACFLCLWVSGPGTKKCVCPILSAVWKSRRAHSALCQGLHEVQSNRTKYERQETWTQRLVSHKLDLTLSKSLILGACIPLGCSVLVVSQHHCCREVDAGESSLVLQLLMQLLYASLPVLHELLFSSESFPFCKVQWLKSYRCMKLSINLPLHSQNFFF